jgi:hypothetical protein
VKPLLGPTLVGLVLVLPSFVWAVLDRSLWQWDQSYYGSAAIDLWATLRLSPGLWPEAMANALVTWPPAIAWFGQFFVPLEGLVGSMRSALLFSTLTALLAALALVYAAGLRLSGGRRLPALVGALAAGSAPLVVNLSHWYLVEPIQILAVVWVLFIMVSTPRWHLSLTTAQLGAAISFGLLVKLSTPAYVAAPAGVALVLSLAATRGGSWGRWWQDARFLASLVLTVVIGFGAAVWYGVNFDTAWAHAELSATSSLWGTEGSFWSHLSFWLDNARDALLLPYADLAVLVLLVASGIVVARHRRRMSISRYHLLVLVGCLGTPLVVLISLASQVNSDARFVVPTIPAVALGLVALLCIVDDVRLTRIAAALFAVQFALITVQSFHADSPSWLTRSAYRSVPASDSSFADEVDRLVRIACTGTAEGTYNTVGGNYAWLNQNTLTMVAAEQFALDGRRCRWAGVTYIDRVGGSGWRELAARESPFFLTLDYGNPANRLPRQFDPTLALTFNPALGKLLNSGNAALLRQVLRSGKYEVVPDSQRSGLILMRRAES